MWERKKSIEPKVMKNLIYLLIPLYFICISCEHDPVYTDVTNEDPGDGGPGDGDPGDGDGNNDSCDPDVVYFVNDVKPIIVSNCAVTGCHGGGSAEDGIELSDYSGMMEIIEAGDAEGSEMVEVITEDDPDDIMPPPPNLALTSEQIATIITWINQGAENNECTSTECDLTNVTFSQTVWPIIQNSCTGCHSGANPQGNLSLTNYNEIADIAGSGFLSGVINHETGFVPMPFNSQQLDQCKIDQIDEWINQGFPDN
jgi:hypothetical protein